ncbi:uncharacterized protein IUM83_12614 [Phytophthora cinnamomi]|uniref:uncharacterized protein n=1 Tax=Phytophthora cinnamomi TaxID=4785 RepID=UPI003559DB55|nr:hypothetical protein IUM83_12614 [Phytophthora cinnamomi]
MSFSYPGHTNFHTGSGTSYSYPNSNQYAPYAPYYPPAPQPQYPYTQAPPPQQQEIPYAVPVDVAPMATPPTRDGLDYSRPQMWRNLPQQQERGTNASTSTGRPPSFKTEPTQRAGRSASNASASSLDSNTQSSTYSDAAMAANASLAAAGVASGAGYAGERSSVSSATSSATRSSVDAAVDTMWEARRAREKAEEEADQKLIDAVCKASLAEFNERERALKIYESETSRRSLEHQTSSAALQQAKTEAEQRKRAAMQTVIDSKSRAKQMNDKAREATALYEQKNSEPQGGSYAQAV